MAGQLLFPRGFNGTFGSTGAGSGSPSYPLHLAESPPFHPVLTRVPGRMVSHRDQREEEVRVLAPI
jgi:hypothetical protein